MEFAKSNREIDDSDNDDEEFEDANREEQEDIIYQSQLRIKKSTNMVRLGDRSVMQAPNRQSNGYRAMIESVVSIDHDNPYTMAS